MKPILTTVLPFLLSLLVACNNKTQEHEKPDSLVKVTFQLTTPSGVVESRELDSFDLAMLVDSPKLFKSTQGEFSMVAEWLSTEIAMPPIKVVGNIKDDVFHGKVDTFYFFKGSWRIGTESTYDLGVKHGPITAYYPNTGTIQIRGQMKDGERNGIFESFYRSGVKSSHITFSQGVLDGTCQTYDSEGNLITSGVYEDGYRVAGEFVDDLEQFLDNTFTEGILVPR